MTAQEADSLISTILSYPVLCRCVFRTRTPHRNTHARTHARTHTHLHLCTCICTNSIFSIDIYYFILLYHILISFLITRAWSSSWFVLTCHTQLPAAMWVQHLVVLDGMHWISWRFTVASHLEAGHPVGASAVFGLIFTIPKHHFFLLGVFVPTTVRSCNE